MHSTCTYLRIAHRRIIHRLVTTQHTAQSYQKVIQAGGMSNANGVNTPTKGDPVGADLEGTAIN